MAKITEQENVAAVGGGGVVVKKGGSRGDIDLQTNRLTLIREITRLLNKHQDY